MNLFISLILTERLHGTSCCVQEKQRGNCSAAHSIWSKCSPEKHSMFLQLLFLSSYLFNSTEVFAASTKVFKFLAAFSRFCFWICGIDELPCSFVTPSYFPSWDCLLVVCIHYLRFIGRIFTSSAMKAYGLWVSIKYNYIVYETANFNLTE